MNFFRSTLSATIFAAIAANPADAQTAPITPEQAAANAEIAAANAATQKAAADKAAADKAAAEAAAKPQGGGIFGGRGRSVLGGVLGAGSAFGIPGADKAKQANDAVIAAEAAAKGAQNVANNPSVAGAAGAVTNAGRVVPAARGLTPIANTATTASNTATAVTGAVRGTPAPVILGRVPGTGAVARAATATQTVLNSDGLRIAKPDNIVDKDGNEYEAVDPQPANVNGVTKFGDQYYKEVPKITLPDGSVYQQIKALPPGETAGTAAAPSTYIISGGKPYKQRGALAAASPTMTAPSAAPTTVVQAPAAPAVVTPVAKPRTAAFANVILNMKINLKDEVFLQSFVKEMFEARGFRKKDLPFGSDISAEEINNFVRHANQTVSKDAPLPEVKSMDEFDQRYAAAAFKLEMTDPAFGPGSGRGSSFQFWLQTKGHSDPDKIFAATETAPKADTLVKIAPPAGLNLG